jgi:cystathionine beta-lyase
MIDFDKIVDRKNTNCYKWDIPEVTENVIPLWVADMDFEAPKEIINELQKRIEHGIFGYSFPPESYFASFINWQKKRNNWIVDKKNLVFSAGVVPGIIMAITSLTEIGDKILIQTPVYGPFAKAITDHKRELVKNKLKYENNYYQIDFEKLESQLSQNVKMMIFCSPQNPIGRVWKKDELIKILDLCRQYKVILVSDEIHSDIIFAGNKHYPIALFANDDDQIITLMSPSKTFNIAGLRSSIAVVNNKKILGKYNSEFFKYDGHLGNLLGYTGFEAAYKYGENWLNSLIPYLEKNAKLVTDFFKNEFPKIRVTKSEGTFLLWINFETLGISGLDLQNFFLEKAKVLLDLGSKYEEENSCFLRFNIGTNRAILKESLKRMKNAIETLEGK